MPPVSTCSLVTPVHLQCVLTRVFLASTRAQGEVSLPLIGETNQAILEKHMKGSDELATLDKNFSLWSSPKGYPERPIYSLQHGERYALQMVVVTDAGKITTFEQPPIVADFTTPVCSTPAIVSIGEPVVPANTNPSGSSTYGGTRMFNWIGLKTSTLYVDINEQTCSDPESGTHAVHVTIGRDMRGDEYFPYTRAPSRACDPTIGEGHGTTCFDPMKIEITWEATALKSRVECDQCGDPSYINIYCMSGAAVEERCRFPAMFRIDGSPPTCSDDPRRPKILGEGKFPWAQAIDDRLLTRGLDTIFDRESGIARVKYYLHERATSDASANLTQNATELEWIEHEGQPLGRFHIRRLRGVIKHSHWYWVTATAYNGVGATGECTLGATLIDMTPPEAGKVYVLAHDRDNLVSHPRATRYQYSKAVIRVAQRNFSDAESGIEAFFMSIYRTDGRPIVTETNIGLRDFTSFAARLQHGQSFFVKWRALNHASESTYVLSNVVTVDITKPRIKYVRDQVDGDTHFLTAPTNLLDPRSPSDVKFVGATDFLASVRFRTWDPESGILEARWCLGTFPGACDAVPLEYANYRLMEGVRSVRGLIDGVWYYTFLEVYNGAGNPQTMVSNGFQVDVSPPECGIIVDGPGYQREFVGPTLARVVWTSADKLKGVGVLAAAWRPFKDAGCGTAGYAGGYAPESLLGLANESNTEFMRVGLGTTVKVSLVLEHTIIYHAVVSSWDRLTNEGKCYSAGVYFDATPPDMRNATIVSYLASRPGYNVQRFDHMISAGITGVVDPESGIREISVALGDEADPESLRPFRSIGTADGQILIGALALPEGWTNMSVRAINNAMERSAGWALLGVDTRKPKCEPVVLNGAETYLAAQYTADVGLLRATWSCFDQAPWRDVPVTCEWAVGTFPGGDDAYAWQPATTVDGGWTWQSEWRDTIMENGFIYFVTARCTDHVGLTRTTSSGGLMPDLIGPRARTPARLINPYKAQLMVYWAWSYMVVAKWNFDDYESGVQHIRAEVVGSATNVTLGMPFDEMRFELPVDPRTRQAEIRFGDDHEHMQVKGHSHATGSAPAPLLRVDLTATSAALHPAHRLRSSHRLHTCDAARQVLLAAHLRSRRDEPQHLCPSAPLSRGPHPSRVWHTPRYERRAASSSHHLAPLWRRLAMELPRP